MSSNPPPIAAGNLLKIANGSDSGHLPGSVAPGEDKPETTLRAPSRRSSMSSMCSEKGDKETRKNEEVDMTPQDEGDEEIQRRKREKKRRTRNLILVALFSLLVFAATIITAPIDFGEPKSDFALEWGLFLRVAMVMVSVIWVGLLADVLRRKALHLVTHKIRHSLSKWPFMISVLSLEYSYFFLFWTISAKIFWHIVKRWDMWSSRSPYAVVHEEGRIDFYDRLLICMVVISCAWVIKCTYVFHTRHFHLSSTLDDKMLHQLIAQVYMTYFVTGSQSLRYRARLLNLLPMEPSRLFKIGIKQLKNRSHEELPKEDIHLLATCAEYIADTGLPKPPTFDYYESEGAGAAPVLEKESEVKELSGEIFAKILAEDPIPGPSLSRLGLRTFMSEAVDERMTDLIFREFDKEKTGFCNSEQFTAALLRWFNDRKRLALTFRDKGTIIRLLDTMISIAVGIVLFIVTFWIMQVSIVEVVVPAMSAILAFSFMFSGTVKLFFESVLFLIAVHPFDTGDTVYVDGLKRVVKQMNVFSTVFLHWDGRLIVYPNSTLMGKAIVNIRRSNGQAEEIVFEFPLHTRSSVVAAMKAELQQFAAANSGDWNPAIDFTVGGYNTQRNTLTCYLWIVGRSNWHYGARWERLEKLLFVCAELCCRYGANFFPKYLIDIEQKGGLQKNGEGETKEGHDTDDELPSPLGPDDLGNLPLVRTTSPSPESPIGMGAGPQEGHSVTRRAPRTLH